MFEMKENTPADTCTYLSFQHAENHVIDVQLLKYQQFFSICYHVISYEIRSYEIIVNLKHIILHKHMEK